MLKFFSVSFIFFISLTSTLFAKEINLNELAAEAAKQNKHLLVWLHKTDCGYCESMREFTLEDDTVAAVLKKSFLFVHINVNENDDVIYMTSKGSGKDFAKKIGYNFYPSSVFLDGKGNIIFAAAGYIEEGDFLFMLRFIESGAYKQMGYDAYHAQEKKR